MSVYQATATRKRPKTLQNLIGQDFISTTLQESIKKGTIAHTYLFSGPRGVGKTSSARALARSLNCEQGPTVQPCGLCSNCVAMNQGTSLNVIEIDGASHTSIQDIREIKEDICFAPNSARYRIYIIDEVHMLSNSAFNGLLKTLEEPPEYVIFILATTELHKIPATVKSRCQQFHFKLIAFDQIVELLKHTCVEKGIVAEEEALIWIAKMSTGSLRDAYTLFDQVVAFSEQRIRLGLIQEKLGLLTGDKLKELVLHLAVDKQEIVFKTLHKFLQQGIALEQLLCDLNDYLRNLLLYQSGVRSIEILGASPAEFDIDIQQYWSREQLETALSWTFETHRRLRYTLNPRFEVELMLSQLCQLKYYLSPSNIWKELKSLENCLNVSHLKDGSLSKEIANLSPKKTKPDHNHSPMLQQKPELEEIQAFISRYIPELACLTANFYEIKKDDKKVIITLSSAYEKNIWKQKQELLLQHWSSHWHGWSLLAQDYLPSEREKIIERVQSLFKGEYVGDTYDT